MQGSIHARGLGTRTIPGDPMVCIEIRQSAQRVRSRGFLRAYDLLRREKDSFCRRCHLCAERRSSLCLLSCCSNSSKAVFTAACAVDAFASADICPEGRRRLNDALVLSRSALDLRLREQARRTESFAHSIRDLQGAPLLARLEEL